MPGEPARIAIALIGTIIVTYFDIFNNRNIPNNLLYAFLAVAFITSIVFFSSEIFIYSIIQFAIIGILGFGLYKMGQLGGADVFCALLNCAPPPNSPHWRRNTLQLSLSPPVAPLWRGSLCSFILFFILEKIIMHQKNLKPNYIYLALLIPYFIFAFIFLNAPFFSTIYFYDSIPPIALINILPGIQGRNIQGNLRKSFSLKTSPGWGCFRQK